MISGVYRPVQSLIDLEARAANPGDIHWAELAVPQGERIKRRSAALADGFPDG